MFRAVRICKWLWIRLNTVHIEYTPLSVWTPKAETFQYTEEKTTFTAFWNAEIWKFKKRRLRKGCSQVQDNLNRFLSINLIKFSKHCYSSLSLKIRLLSLEQQELTVFIAYSFVKEEVWKGSIFLIKNGRIRYWTVWA